MMKLVLFPSVTITKGREIDTEWSAFAKEYLCKHTPQITKDGELYAGAVYESGNVKREDANVIGRTAVIFDFDNKDCDISQPEDHADNLEGLTWAWHSTFSSTPDLPKFRVVIPLDRMATPQEWPVVFRGAMSLIGNDPAVDSGSADLSRAYYRPAYHPSNKGQEFSGFVDGKPLSVDEMLELGGGANVVPFSMPTPKPSPATVPIQPKNRQYDGRNDALKAQVAACMAKGKGVDATVTEVMDYDRRNHKSPLFSDPKENRGQTNSYQNALRFVTSIMGSVNTRREAQGLPPEIPGSVSPDEPAALNIVKASSFADRTVPDRKWLVPEWIPMGQTTALYGTGGIGKTLAAQQLMTSVATGKPWLGQECRQGAVLGIFCEDSEDELHIRQDAINRAFNIKWPACSAMHMVSRVGEDNLYITFDREHGDGELTAFWHQVREAAMDIKPALLVSDTAADTFGGNENNRSQVRQYIQRCLTHIAVEIGCAHLLCAHPSVSGLNSTNDATRGSGGSTAWNNSVRSRLYLYEDEEQGIALERVKSNYAKKGGRIDLVWSQGAFIQKSVAAGFTPDPVDQCLWDFLTLLDVFTKQGRNVSDKVQGQYAPRLFAHSGREYGFNWDVSRYKQAMERGLKDGKLRLEEARKGRSIRLVKV